MRKLPSSNVQPENICGPRNLDDGCSLSGEFISCLSSAPAIGGPIKLENAEIPHDIPVRVPSRFGSGQRSGNTAAGRVTRPAEQNPQNTASVIIPLFPWVTLIQQNERMPDTAAQHIQVAVALRTQISFCEIFDMMIIMLTPDDVRPIRPTGVRRMMRQSKSSRRSLTMFE
jgi:hypothetical protein